MLRSKQMALPRALPALVRSALLRAALLRAALLLPLGATLGCSGDELAAGEAMNAQGGSAAEAEAGPVREGNAGPPPSGEYGGTYFVPVPAELEAYAHFEVSEIRLEQGSAELRLSYDLPELLLGESRGVSFRGGLAGDGSYLLTGDAGSARCQQLDTGLRCEEALRVQPDTQKLDQLLQRLPEPEARARRAVTDRFAIDPIGILTVELER